ncbi:hypothetical protein AAMO2058_001286500 [Amorphochlora amoebiformis]|mmetsp:Transcript_4911/g.7486  ORF Transcript_4911/g.7486 Transcript_4911/m.7486 type:complete len:365 (-) Transcript_4911:118-1212(-)
MSVDLLPKLQRLLDSPGFKEKAQAFSSELVKSLLTEAETAGYSGSTDGSEEFNESDDDKGKGTSTSRRTLTRRDPLQGVHLGGSRKRKAEYGENGGKRRRSGDEDEREEEARDLETLLLSALSRIRNGNRGGPKARGSRRSIADLTDLRKQIISTSIHMQSSGLVLHTSGNVSIRVPSAPDLMLVTPTGMDYKALKPSDIVLMDFKGRPYNSGQRKPSSEWRFHGDIYLRRTDVKAIVHTHSTFCTTMSCLRQGIPAFHYMVGAAGGSTIRCAKYGTYGTQDLSDAAVEALKGRKACLLANHGMIAVGKDLKSALKLAEIVENLCEMYWRSLQATGGPVILDDKEMDIILKKFKSYGKQPKSCC